MRMRSRGAERLAALVTAGAIVVAACGAGAPTPAPGTPRPVVTPDPHLSSPALADDVWRALSRGGLRIVANNATAGEGGDEPVKRINATFLGWPLFVSQYASERALAKANDWEHGATPGDGEAPFTFAGMNILVTWGPSKTGRPPTKPDARKSAGLTDLIRVLDPLLSPLRARAIVPVALPSTPQSASAEESAGPSAAPDATNEP